MEALATVSKGTAEFLADGERLQPKVLEFLFHSSQAAFPSHVTVSVATQRRAVMSLLTSQMIKSLKKTMSAVLSDICVEWLFPETEEVLLSPVGNTFLFPGDSLIGYSVVCDTTRYHANPKSVSDVFRYSCLPGCRVRRDVPRINVKLSTGQEEEIQHDALR